MRCRDVSYLAAGRYRDSACGDADMLPMYFGTPRRVGGHVSCLLESRGLTGLDEERDLGLI